MNSRTFTPVAGLRTGTLELVDRLGVGGVAEVYRAVRRGPGLRPHVVAIKKMRPEAVNDPFFSERFMAEADLVKMLRHPNVVGGHEVGMFEGQPYVLLDYVDGKDLAGVIRGLRESGRTLDTGAAVYVACELLKALAYVHQLRSPTGRELLPVHRDVTPENVLVSYTGNIKLTDFGVAQLDGIEIAPEGAPVAGKLGYMSPEQAAHQTVDARTDLFAVGCILYELTVGLPTFTQAPGETEAAVHARVVDARFTRPSKVVADYPKDLEAVLVCALDRRANRRYQTAQTFLHALTELLFLRPDEPQRLSAIMRDIFWREYDEMRLPL